MSDPRYIYTIIASGEKFTLTKDQIESDPGNFFQSYFFGGFSEASSGTRELVEEKEPRILKLIQAHLRGYDIFPLSDRIIPDYLTKETMLNNLFKEAQFYGLGLLCQKIQEHKTSDVQTPSTPSIRYMFGHSTDGNWSLMEITKGAFDLHLQRFRNSKHELFVPRLLIHPHGYMTHVAWTSGDQAWALLEPIDQA